MKALRIKNWDALYESNESRKRQDLHWVKMPNSHDGLGYRKLIAGRNGAAMFGAWCAIVQVASKRPKHLRGCLVGDDGTPMTSEDLALMTGLPAIDFERCIKKALSGAVGWLEEFEPAARPADDAGAPADDAARPVPNRREEKRREEKRDISARAGDELPRPVVAAVAALDRWSFRARGYGLKPVNNETRLAEEWAGAVAEKPPVHRAGQAIPALDLVPEVVDVLIERGTDFKNVAYATACVLNELDSWRRRGPPGSGPPRASGPAGVLAAIEFRRERADRRDAS